MAKPGLPDLVDSVFIRDSGAELAWRMRFETEPQRCLILIISTEFFFALPRAQAKPVVFALQQSSLAPRTCAACVQASALWSPWCAVVDSVWKICSWEGIRGNLWALTVSTSSAAPTYLLLGVAGSSIQKTRGSGQLSSRGSVNMKLALLLTRAICKSRSLRPNLLRHPLNLWRAEIIVA